MEDVESGLGEIVLKLNLESRKGQPLDEARGKQRISSYQHLPITGITMFVLLT